MKLAKGWLWAAVGAAVVGAVLVAANGKALVERPGPSKASSGEPPKLAAQPSDLVPLLEPIRTKHAAPGIIAAILAGDRVTAIGATGVRKIGSSAALTTGDLVHLGSCTKAMTATLIGRLVDAHKLDWEDALRKALPRLAATMHPDAAGITVRQLLEHTAGLPANVDWWAYERSGKPLPDQRWDIARDVLSKAPASKPGQTYSYSNVGYVVLGSLLERHRGKPWETVIRDELFTPLGMASAGFGAPGTRDGLDQPWGHLGRASELRPVQFDNAPCLGPAGRVHCTIEDWARFITVHLRAGRGQPGLLSSEAFKVLQTPRAGQTYTGGWRVHHRDWGGTVLTHAGSNTTWYCVVWMSPERDFAVLVVTNSGQPDADNLVDEVSWALIQRHLGGSGGRNR